MAEHLARRMRMASGWVRADYVMRTIGATEASTCISAAGGGCWAINGELSRLRHLEFCVLNVRAMGHHSEHCIAHRAFVLDLRCRYKRFSHHEPRTSPHPSGC